MYCIVVPVHVPAAIIHIAIEYDFFSDIEFTFVESSPYYLSFSECMSPGIVCI